MVRLSGPLWASASLPAGPQPASQPAKRMTGSLVVIPPASQPASQFPSRLSAVGQAPWSSFCLWGAFLVVVILVGSLPGRNSACGEALGLKWISVWNPKSSRSIHKAFPKPSQSLPDPPRSIPKHSPSLPKPPRSLPKAVPKPPQASQASPDMYIHMCVCMYIGRAWIEQASPSLPEAFPKHSPSLPQASPKHSQAFPGYIPRSRR